MHYTPGVSGSPTHPAPFKRSREHGSAFRDGDVSQSTDDMTADHIISSECQLRMQCF
jgi:hypothetical protein